MRGLVPADALADLDDHVLAVGRVGLDERELELLLEARELLLELGHHLLQVAVVARRLEVVVQVSPPLRQSRRALELLRAPSDLRGFAVVVVDVGVAQPLLRLAVGALDLVYELGELGHAAKVSAVGARPSRAEPPLRLV